MQGGRFDLHVHTRASKDSSLSVEDVLRDALVQGLQGVAITDHNSVAALPSARKAFESAPGFLLLPGVEVSTREGHLLVYGIEKAPAAHRPLAETLDEVARLGGVPVLAHPYRWAHGVGKELARTSRVLGIETMNGRNSEVPNAKAGVVAASRQVAATGGSDAHERGSIGRCFTRFSGEVRNAEDLLELLRHGHTQGEGRSQGLEGRVRISLKNAGKRLLRGLSGV
ncbi:MAG: CehA/McbA family metallohydrolase [Euryarchaeota archaeon]|nr:CehA/McbA family metallohydrolase [Euryarchaeota archaeon]